MTAPATLERLLTDVEVAELLQQTPGYLRRLRHEGRGPRFIKLGRNVRYKPSAINEYIEECAA